MAKSNAELLADVREELEWEPEVEDDHIAIVVVDGAVTLSGHVPSYFQKTKAVEATERVSGVKVVADELEVRLPDARVRDDSDLAESIAHVLSWSAVIPEESLQAKVSSGNVTLTGSVDWEYVRDEAVRLVKRLAGVRTVTNLVAVRSRPTADQVEKKIADALARHAALDARHIHVSIEDSTAVLTGHVRSIDEARRVRHAAMSAVGIAEVDDRLEIEP